MSGLTYGRNTAAKAVVAACQLTTGYEGLKAVTTVGNNIIKISESTKSKPFLTFDILNFDSGSQLRIRSYTCTIDVVRSIAQNIQLILPEISIHIE